MTKEKFTISKFFKFQSLETTFKKEIIGGISTFLSLIYIVSVQQDILSSSPSVVEGNSNMNIGEIFLSTSLVMAIGTIVIGISSNAPIAFAPGMGLNAMFAYNVASKGVGYEGALIATMISSILFVVFATTKLRHFIAKAIPESIHLGIGIGLGFFVAYVGLSGMHWVSTTQGGMPIADLSNLKTYYPSIIMGTSLFFIMLLFNFKKIPGGVAIAIGIGLIISLILANTINSNVIETSFGQSKWDEWSYDDLNGFGKNIKNTWNQFTNKDIWNKPIMYSSIFLFLLIMVFDTSGVLAIATVGMSDDKEYQQLVTKKVMIATSVSSVIGSTLGASPAISTLESNIGISQGARSGFASVITGLLFIAMIGLYPIFKLIPTPVISAASLFVGSMMVINLKDIEWKLPEITIPVFLMIIFMVVTYNITNGIAIGIISYTIMSLILGKQKNVSPTLWVLTILFITYFISYAFSQ